MDFESNKVSINIPRSNPLFEWAWSAALKMNKEPIEYGSLTVGDVTSRLVLTHIKGMRGSVYGDEPYLETEWLLLIDPRHLDRK